MVKSKTKVAIIGSGFVGSSSAFALAMNGLVSELVLIDVNKEKAFGEALDISHGLSFISQMNIYSGDYSDISDADVIVITAGANRKPGETRLDLAKKNVSIMKGITENIMKYYKQGVILVVSNPVDVLTYMISKWTNLPAGKVIGSGTSLDSARFRYLLSKHCNVDVRNIHGYIIGEHGDSQIPVWSATNIGGTRLMDYCAACTKSCSGKERAKIAEEVKNSGAVIIQNKGATYYAIALSVTRIVEALLKNQNSVLTLSSVIKGNYGINDVALSLPSVINSNGIDRVFDVILNEEETNALQNSAAQIKAVIDQVKDI